MPTYKPITLKMSTAPAYGYTSIKQMDVEGVELILTLRNTDDSDYNLTSGSTLFFKMANESGNVKVTLSEMDSPSNITRDGANVVKVLLTESMVSETGIMACELQEMHSGTFTSSQLFYLRVWPTTEDGEIIDSHEYKSLVSAYLAIDNALNVATLAKNYSESTITEENARQAAELLRKQAESARVAAENLRGVEVANARGGHATLGDRLDDVDVGIEGNTSEVENTKLKVVRLEQEVKRYKELYEQSNPTQSPRVSSVGYGVVSLPKNAANGQVSASVKGNTVTDENGTAHTVSACRLKATGKNLFDISKVLTNDEVTGTGRVINNGSHLTVRTTPSDASGRAKAPNKLSDYAKLKIGETYILTATTTGTFKYIYLSGVNKTWDFGTTKTITQAMLDSIVRFYASGVSTTAEISNIQIELGSVATPYEPYTFTTQYYPDCGLLRSVGSANDEVSDGKHIQRIGTKTNVASGTVIDYADMADGGQYYAWNDEGETETGVKGDTLGIDATSLTYQLAEPIVTPVNVTGTLVGHPKGTVYWEPVLPVAGVYTASGIEVTDTDFPIDSIERIAKIDFMTGVETEVDVSQAVIAGDGLSFTHAELADGDIVFFTYFHGIEGTQPKITAEYYDSRYTVKDSETEQFYRWKVSVANGVPSLEIEVV